MSLTKQDLRSAFLLKVHDKNQDEWSDTDVDLLLWEATVEIINEIEESEPSYFLYTTTFTHTANTTTMPLSNIETDTSLIRKIVGLQKLNNDGSVYPITINRIQDDERWNRPFPIIRSEYVHGNPSVYFVRDSLLFWDPPEEDWGIQVEYTKEFSYESFQSLATSSTFTYLPAQVHPLIYLSAAVSALTAENAERSRVDPLERELGRKKQLTLHTITDRQLQTARYGRYIGD